ncbi:MAG: hypothetical protein RLZZ360_748 [Candidatus Parcubacteria bacterium]
MRKKIRAEAQGFKRNKSSSGQGSLPASRQTQTAAAVVVPVVADVKTLGNEVADEDTETVRVETRRANVDARQQIGVANGLEGRHAPRHFGNVRGHLVVGQKSLLLGPVLRGRLRDRLLAKHDPAGFGLVVLGERLLGIPAAFLRVEVVLLEAANLEEGHGAVGSSDQHVAVVAAPLEHFLRRNGVAELRELVVGIDDRFARLHDILGGDEILAEDGADQFVVRRFRREATDPREHVGGEARVLVESLRAIFIESGLIVLGAERFGSSLSFRTVCGYQCRRVQ